MASSTVLHSSTQAQAEDSRPWACDHPGCTLAFRKRAHLSRHRDTHIDPNSPEYEDKIFRCTYVDDDGNACDHKTFQKSNMETHMLTHTGERPYPCRGVLCLQAFKDRSVRLRHERKDHGIMPAERRPRAKPAQTQAMADAGETTNGSKRFTPYPIPSGSTASTSVASSSSGSGGGYPQSSSVPTFPFGDASGPFHDNTVLPENGPAAASEMYSNMTIPPFEDTYSAMTIPPFENTMTYPYLPVAPPFSNFNNVNQERFQGQGTSGSYQLGYNSLPASCPVYSDPWPFYGPSYAHPASQPPIHQQSFQPNANIPQMQAYPQMDPAFNNSFYTGSGSSASTLSYSNGLMAPSIPNGSDNSWLSQEDLVALNTLYSPFPPSQAPLPPSYMPNYF